MTKFEQAISTNINHTISRALSDGTCGMSMTCLMQNTKTPPDHLKGAPKGSNAPALYKKLFEKEAIKYHGYRGFQILPN